MILVSASIAAKNESAIWNANKLQGTNISSSAPSTNHVLTYNGSQWVGATPPAGTTNLTMTGSSSPFTLNSDTGTDVTFAAGTGIELTRSTNQLTIASTLTAPQTWGDFTTNIQSWGSTGTFGSGKDVGIGGAPSRDFDVIGDARLRGAIYNSSNSAGTTGQVLTSQGASAWTWETPASAATNLTFSGASSPFTLNSSSGTDVTFTAGSGIGLSASSGNITLTATDASATNELQTISTSGAAGNITLSNGGGTLNLNVNDADASATNEAQTLSSSSGAVSLSAVSGTGGGTVTFAPGVGIKAAYGSNYIEFSSDAGHAELYASASIVNNSFSSTTKVNFTSGFGSSFFTVSTADDRITNATGATKSLRITYSGSYKTGDEALIKFIPYRNGSALGYHTQTLTGNGSNYNIPTSFSKSFIINNYNNNDYLELFYGIESGTPGSIEINNIVFNIEIIH